ncbi:MAG TPA: hypothetical protein VIK91_00660 [Nannocystis sp.]
MVLRTDPDTRFGRIGISEVCAEPRLRALFHHVDAIHPAPVRVGPDGTLRGELPVDVGVVFLPEPCPADLATPRDWIRLGLAALQWILLAAIAVSFAFVMTYDHERDTVLWPIFGGWLVILAVVAVRLAAIDRPQVPLRTEPQAPPGNPGIFLLRDALVVRRGGTCDIFPRHAILAIGESTRRGEPEFGAPPLPYPITQITYQAPRGACTYTLEIGPPIAILPDPELTARQQLRTARLRRLQTWLNG